MHSMMRGSFRCCLMVATAVAVLGTLGCSSHAVYPPEWPTISPPSSNACPSLAGEYRNAGEYGSTNGGSPRYSPPYLSIYFYSDQAAAARAERVRVSQAADGRLRIEPIGGDQTLSPVEIQTGEDYRCESGWLVMKSSRSVAENVSGYESNTYRFIRADDRSLIVQIDSSAIGVVLVVPVAGSSTEWQRFLPVE